MVKQSGLCILCGYFVALETLVTFLFLLFVVEPKHRGKKLFSQRHLSLSPPSPGDMQRNPAVSFAFGRKERMLARLVHKHYL